MVIHEAQFLSGEFNIQPKNRCRNISPASVAVKVRLFVVESSDARQLQTFQKFQGSAATGGDVGHFVGKAQLGYRCNAVAAADDQGIQIRPLVRSR